MSPSTSVGISDSSLVVLQHEVGTGLASGSCHRCVEIKAVNNELVVHQIRRQRRLVDFTLFGPTILHLR